METLDIVFIVCALAYQMVLNIHFAMRKWQFATAMRYGWIVYALSLPAAVASLFMLLGGKPWWMWLAGFLYLIWAGFGYVVEYVRKIEWRDPPRWPVLAPYLALYFATTMFYWFPLARVSKPLWYVAGALFVLSTPLNLLSHQRPVGQPTAPRA
mgnify:FL=1